MSFSRVPRALPRVGGLIHLSSAGQRAFGSVARSKLTVFSRTPSQDTTSSRVMNSVIVSRRFASIEANEGNFSAIMESSAKRPLIVCCHDNSVPSRELLSRVTAQAEGKWDGFQVVSLDVVANPNITRMLQLTQVPTVLAVVQGRLVNSFGGFLPAADIGKWLQVTGSKLGMVEKSATETAEGTIALGEEMLAKKEWVNAAELFNAVLQKDEWSEKEGGVAKAGLVFCCMGLGEVAEAKSIAANIRESHREKLNHELVRKALAQVDLLPESDTPASVLRERLAADPLDHAARVDLARILFSAGEAEEAINEAMEIVKKDRKWNEGAAQQLLVQMFDALGSASPITLKGRRRLSNYLFN